ncbi:hypothetical protein, partial [Amycolatopsis rhizosphaerae]
PQPARTPVTDTPHRGSLPHFGGVPERGSQLRYQETIREWEGLPPGTMILVPEFDVPPMRCPADAWAMLVSAVDVITDADHERAGEVALFAGCWMVGKPPANNSHDGDLVVRLTAPADPLASERLADVELLLAHQGRWQRVGLWQGLDDNWPRILAPTAAALMGLKGDATQVAGSPGTTRAVCGVAELLGAGLVTEGEELIWERPLLGLRCTARVRSDGALVLTDGRAYASPSAAITALGSNRQNGWGAFRRMPDGRTLADLRNELRERRGQ